MEPDPPPDLPLGLPPPLPPQFTDSPKAAGPWGFWATIGWSILIAAGYILTQSIAAGIFIALGGVPDFDPHNLEDVFSNGELLAFVTLATAPVVVCLCLGAARRRKGPSLKEYFGLRWPPHKTALRWFGAFLVFLVIVDLALSMIDGAETEQFIRTMLATTSGLRPQLWLALVLAAPISEEMFFRGFLFTGLRHSRLGGYGTVLVTAVAFACIHLQYDTQGLLFVFAVGLFFGLARLKTDSVWLCAALHGLMNFLSTLWFVLFDDL